MIKNAILLYVIIQSLTTAIGLFFIYSTQGKVNEQILKRNYKLANANSLYTFNNKLNNVLKAFIPFYYFVKGLNIIKDNGDFQHTVDKAIASGKYIPINLEQKKEISSITYPKPNIEEKFTKEKFKAIKNNTNIYNPDETPIEYIEKIMENEYEIKLTPYIDNNDYIPPIQNIEEDKENLSLPQILPYLSQLSPLELEILLHNIEQLIISKEKSYKRVLEKDIA